MAFFDKGLEDERARDKLRGFNFKFNGVYGLGVGALDATYGTYNLSDGNTDLLAYGVPLAVGAGVGVLRNLTTNNEFNGMTSTAFAVGGSVIPGFVMNNLLGISADNWWFWPVVAGTGMVSGLIGTMASNRDTVVDITKGIGNAALSSAVGYGAAFGALYGAEKGLDLIQTLY